MSCSIFIAVAFIVRLEAHASLWEKWLVSDFTSGMSYHVLTHSTDLALVTARELAKSDTLVRVPPRTTLAMTKNDTSSEVRASQSASVARVAISSCSTTGGIARCAEPVLEPGVGITGSLLRRPSIDGQIRRCSYAERLSWTGGSEASESANSGDEGEELHSCW